MLNRNANTAATPLQSNVWPVRDAMYAGAKPPETRFALPPWSVNVDTPEKPPRSEAVIERLALGALFGTADGD